MSKKALCKIHFAFWLVLLQVSFIYASNQEQIVSGETRPGTISGPSFIEA